MYGVGSVLACPSDVLLAAREGAERVVERVSLSLRVHDYFFFFFITLKPRVG